VGQEQDGKQDDRRRHHRQHLAHAVVARVEPGRAGAGERGGAERRRGAEAAGGAQSLQRDQRGEDGDDEQHGRARGARAGARERPDRRGDDRRQDGRDRQREQDQIEAVGFMRDEELGALAEDVVDRLRDGEGPQHPDVQKPKLHYRGRAK
jgi:hypothetical protein